MIRIGDRSIADTREALVFRASDYPAVRRVPRKDVDMAALSRSETRISHPYKGDPSCFGIPASGERAVDAVWICEEPRRAVTRIKGHLAFYPDRVDGIEVEG